MMRLNFLAKMLTIVAFATAAASCSDDDTAPIPVTGVNLNQANITLVMGTSDTLTAKVTPADASNKNVAWSSSNDSVATVSNGVVKAVSTGEAIITVTTQDGNKTANCTVKVIANAIAVTGITISKDSTTLAIDAIENLTVTITPDDATNKKVTWSSSNDSIATVNKVGLVTAKKEGEAKIIVTTEDGGLKDTCVVTVSLNAIAVTGVELDKNELDIIEGADETLTATVKPDNATNKNVTWKSSDETVATISENGKVTAVSAGEATITVTTEEGGKTADCKVTVKANVIAVTSVELNKNTLVLNEGADETLTATVKPDNATNKNVTWKSSDESVATVNSDGKVTAISAGEATITVTTEDGGKTADCKVTVEANVIAVTSVELNKNTLVLNEGADETLTATVKPDNATNKNVTWKSSDESIATVNSDGKVTAVSAGAATITVTTEDGGKTDICNVTVE
jgi:uncharacterized protein YjdB